MTSSNAELYFDAAVGLATLNFSISVEVEHRIVEFEPKGFDFKVIGSIARANDVSIFLRLAKDHAFSEICGVSIFAFDNNTLDYFENGAYSRLELYPLGRGVLNYAKQKWI